MQIDMQCAEALSRINRERDTLDMLVVTDWIRSTHFDSKPIAFMDYLEVRMFFTQAVFMCWYHCKPKVRPQKGTH